MRKRLAFVEQAERLTKLYEMPLTKKELNISLSRNPAKEMIMICGFNEKGDVKIAIADMNGYVWVKALSHQKPALRIDVSRLKAGHYLVSVNNGKEMKTIQFVKE